MTGFKTFLFGLLVAIAAPAIVYLETFKETLANCGIDPQTAEQVCGLPGWVGSVVGVVIIALRFVTKTSIFKKDE